MGVDYSSRKPVSSLPDYVARMFRKYAEHLRDELRRHQLTIEKIDVEDEGASGRNHFHKERRVMVYNPNWYSSLYHGSEKTYFWRGRKWHVKGMRVPNAPVTRKIGTSFKRTRSLQSLERIVNGNDKPSVEHLKKIKVTGIIPSIEKKKSVGRIERIVRLNTFSYDLTFRQMIYEDLRRASLFGDGEITHAVDERGRITQVDCRDFKIDKATIAYFEREEFEKVVPRLNETLKKFDGVGFGEVSFKVKNKYEGDRTYTIIIPTTMSQELFEEVCGSLKIMPNRLREVLEAEFYRRRNITST